MLFFVIAVDKSNADILIFVDILQMIDYKSTKRLSAFWRKPSTTQMHTPHDCLPCTGYTDVSAIEKPVSKRCNAYGDPDTIALDLPLSCSSIQWIHHALTAMIRYQLGVLRVHLAVCRIRSMLRTNPGSLFFLRDLHTKVSYVDTKCASPQCKPFSSCPILETFLSSKQMAEVDLVIFWMMDWWWSLAVASAAAAVSLCKVTDVHYQKDPWTFLWRRTRYTWANNEYLYTYIASIASLALRLLVCICK